jgi:two-component system, cell cycle sensor histidine kinase and response regulator CckA
MGDGASPRLLIVDDEASQMTALCETLRAHGYETVGHTAPAAALAALREQRFDLVLADLTMPGMNGIALLQAAVAIDPDVVGVIMTGEGSIASAVDAMRSGALDYILKPFRLRAILPVLARALATRALRIENVRLAAHVHQRTTELETANAELRALQAELESRVIARTADLQHANEQLQREMGERRQAEEALRRSEDQLRQAQKMEAIGRLAGGIAHDFNNLLSVILSYSELLLQSEDDLAGRPMIVEMNRAGERAAELTRQLLAFSRRQVLEPKVLDLNQVLAQLSAMLARVLGEDIDLKTLPLAPVATVRADPGQLEQVIMNLVVNARDAMPTGGKMTLATSSVELEEAYAVDHLEVTAGPYVLLTVSDTGVGMAEATRARVFEPFFTTKPLGQGTGLGLSTVYGIVKQSGGTIWVYSEPGNGTTFKIYLPRVEEAPSAGPVAEAPAAVGGIETILLIEDEDQVRQVATDILTPLGYRVLAAHGPEHAERLCATHPDPIELLLTDVVMPEVDGPQLARRISRLRPGIRVLFMSGYTDDAIVHRGLLDSGTAFVAKPLTPLALARKVRAVLDAAPNT